MLGRMAKIAILVSRSHVINSQVHLKMLEMGEPTRGWRVALADAVQETAKLELATAKLELEAVSEQLRVVSLLTAIPATASLLTTSPSASSAQAQVTERERVCRGRR